MYVYLIAHEVMLHGSIFPILLGRHSPGGDHVLCKSTDVTTGHIKLIGHAFTMTSQFDIACVQCGPVVQWEFCILWSQVQFSVGKIMVHTADET